MHGVPASRGAQQGLGDPCAVGRDGGCSTLAAGGAASLCPPSYWWLKINALATRGDWEEMEKFSKSKKSPIGYLVRAFLAQGGPGPAPC